MSCSWGMRVVVIALAAGLLPAAAAQAAITATVSVQRTGGPKIVVRLASPKPLTARARPTGVTVKVAGRPVKLTRVSRVRATVSLGTWRSAKLTGATAKAALALGGRRVQVSVRSRQGTTRLSVKVPAAGTGTGTNPGPVTGTIPVSPGGTTPAPPPPAPGTTPAPPFAAPGTELSGDAAFANIKPYFLDSEFSDCPGGRWPVCTVEHRYEHTASGQWEYHRCTPTSGSDINAYDNAVLTGAAQHADGSWAVEYRTGTGGFYHWEVGQDRIVNGYYEFPQGSNRETMTGYVWRQPAHSGDCGS